MNETKPNQSFFGSPVTGAQAEQKSQEFVSKGANRKLDESYDINFTIGSEFFFNMISFTDETFFDVIMWFKKKEMKLLVFDPSNTHASSIRFDRVEFANYNVKGLENDDSEKIVYLDTSVIINELSINENYPIDFYVDTLVKNRFYVVNGKEIVHGQLNNYKQDLINRYKSLDTSINNLINQPDYQKIVITQGAINNLLKSLSKKVSKKKDETTISILHLKKGELNFVVESETKGSDIALYGEDLMISPQKEDSVSFILNYFTKLSKLKMSFNASLFINKQLPIIFESKFGGNKIVLYYLIAPRIEDEKR